MSLKDEMNIALNLARGRSSQNDPPAKATTQPKAETSTQPKTENSTQPKTETNEREPGFTGWIKWVLSPGIGEGVINFTRVCIFVLLVFLSVMSLIRYNIHFIMLTIITVILYACFEFTIQELRKYPDIMSGKIPDAKEKESNDKPNEESNDNSKEQKPKEE